MFKAELISTNVLYNYVEKGDTLYVTATFRNAGDEPLYEEAQVAVDVIFCGRHRREQNQATNFRFTWKPFPKMSNWESGDIWTTTGAWAIPQTWGASFDLKLSIITESGETIKIIGKDGKEVFSENIGEIELGWGWGRGRLLQQRKPIDMKFNNAVPKTTHNVEKTVSLGDMVLSANRPLALGWGDKKWLNIAPGIRERKISSNSIVKYNLTDKNSKLVSLDDKKAVYNIKTENVSANVVIEKHEDKFTVGVTDVKQSADYELIDIEIPGIAQSNSEKTILTNYFGGGRLFNLSDTLMQSVSFIFDACNTVTAGDSDVMFCLNASDADNVLIQSVAMDASGKKTAVLGVRLIVNMPANKKGFKSIPIDVVPVELYAIKNGDWKSSAFILQKFLPENPRQLYNDTLIYKLDSDSSAQYNPENPDTWRCKEVFSLEFTDKYIEKIANLTDNANQVVYLVGWQTGGHDFEYPYPYRSPFNPKVGTKEEFLDMQERNLKRNVKLSFHDNFDDAYLSENYELDKNLLCFNEKGEPHKGWLWSGGMSYIMSPSKYLASDEIDNRIKSTVEQYHIDKVGTYHLDVLTSENCRYDFTQDKLSGAQKNLEAKIGITKKFNQYGVDITSEVLSLPYLDAIGFAHGPRCLLKGELFKGDMFVPLTTLAMHGVVPYPGKGSTDMDFVNALYLGASVTEYSYFDSYETIVKKLYTVFMPMAKFMYKKVKDIEYSKSRAKVIYDNNSYIDVNIADGTYEIVFEGRKIAYNFNTLVDYKDKYYIFSKDGGEMELALVDDTKHFKVTELSFEGRGKSVEAEAQNGVLKFRAQPMIPYVVEKV